MLSKFPLLSVVFVHVVALSGQNLMGALDTGRLEVVATSYDLLRMCADQLKKVHFDAVLFDEYHTIKSASAMVSQAACELKTKRVFGLTGTLIQNDMKELWFLLHRIDPLAVGEQVKQRRYRACCCSGTTGLRCFFSFVFVVTDKCLRKAAVCAAVCRFDSN